MAGRVPTVHARPLAPGFVCAGYELMDVTRSAPIDGALSLTIAYPLAPYGHAAIETMVKARRAGADAGTHSPI